MSKEFKAAKENSGLSLAEIAKKTGFARCTICRIINETSRSKLENAITVGETIGLDRKKVASVWSEEKSKKAIEKAGV